MASAGGRFTLSDAYTGKLKKLFDHLNIVHNSLNRLKSSKFIAYQISNSTNLLATKEDLLKIFKKYKSGKEFYKKELSNLIQKEHDNFYLNSKVNAIQLEKDRTLDQVLKCEVTWMRQILKDYSEAVINNEEEFSLKKASYPLKAIAKFVHKKIKSDPEQYFEISPDIQSYRSNSLNKTVTLGFEGFIICHIVKFNNVGLKKNYEINQLISNWLLLHSDDYRHMMENPGSYVVEPLKKKTLI